MTDCIFTFCIASGADFEPGNAVTVKFATEQYPISDIMNTMLK